MFGMIIFYTGRKGSGKTLTMVKDAYNYKSDGYEVYSNFKTSFTQPISNKDLMKLDKNSHIKDCVLLIDELQVLFDSRRSMKKENMNFSNFLQQIRKRNIILLGSTQYSSTVDVRFRQHVDILVKPMFYKDYNVVEVKYVDLNSTDEDKFEPDSITLVYIADDVFGLYDTRELVLIEE